MKYYLPARFATLCICLSTLAVPLIAQSTEPAVSPRPQVEGPAVRVETSLVSTPVSVLDRQGKFVTGLRKGDFRIFEDEVEQEIEGFAAVEVPFHLVLLLDTSRSTIFRLEEIQQAAIDFVDQLRPQDTVMVISFDDAVSLDSEFTNDHRQLRRAIRNTRTGTSTRLYDAVELAITERLDEVPGRKAIVLFTDGTDTASRLSSSRATVARVEELDVLVYVVQYNTGRDLQNLVLGRGVTIGGIKSSGQQEPGYVRELAERSGGRLYQAENMPSFNRAFAEIAGELRNQYWLSYYPTKEARDGSYRRLRVRVNRSDVAVRAREGYRASAEESAIGPDPAPGRMNRPNAQSGGRQAGTVSTPADEVTVKTKGAPLTIPVSAIDEDGQAVGRLAKRDFHLYEDGVEQQIVGFGSTEEPFQIALLIDTSRSTLTKLKAMQQTAIEFVEQLRPQDRVMVVSFDDQVYLDTEMTDNRDEWRRAIRGTRVGRGARLFDAIDLTITERLSRLGGRKAIVLLTDGVDSGSQYSTALSTIVRANNTGILVYPIQYLSRLMPRTVFNPDSRGRDSGDQAKYFYMDIAERSGAEFHRADTLTDLRQAFREVAEDLSHQYWLSYYPADVAIGSKVRRIRVSVGRPGVFTRARKGL